MSHKRLTILLVEDNPGDVYLFKAALEECAARVDLKVCDNGLDAWHLLDLVDAGKTPPPDLVVLDLNLPGMSGRDILAEMAHRPALHTIPVCIFTGAAMEEGIVAEHPPLRLCFYAKVDDFSKLRETVERFLDFAAANSAH